MKAAKIFTSIVALLSLGFYGWKLFGNSNGKKYAFDKTHNIYYKGEGLTEGNAKDLAEYLKEQEYFAGDHEASIQISKTDETKDTVNLKFVVDKSKLTPDIENVFFQLGTLIPKKVFNGAPVNVYLANEDLEDIKDLGYAKPAEEEKVAIPQTQSSSEPSVTDPAAKLAPKYKEIIPNNKIYYSDASAPKLDIMTDYLSNAGFFKPDRQLSIVFDKNDQGYFLMLPFSEKYLNDNTFLQNVQQMDDDIQKKFFPDEHFTLYACDLNFKPAYSYVSSRK